MFTSAVVSIVVRNTIFRKAPPSVVSSYGKRSIPLKSIYLQIGPAALLVLVRDSSAVRWLFCSTCWSIGTSERSP
jgi:hypothetical protein